MTHRYAQTHEVLYTCPVCQAEEALCVVVTIAPPYGEVQSVEVTCLDGCTIDDATRAASETRALDHLHDEDEHWKSGNDW